MPSHPLCNTAPAARWLGLALLLLSLGLLVMGVAVGSTGLEAVWRWPHDAIAQQIIVEIRLPRTLGAWLAGALLGLAGAVAQGLFRNPLADPYLLGSASGAALGGALALLLAGGAPLGLLWLPRLAGAVVAIGNAPTALFHLLEVVEVSGVKPAAVVGIPVGFVGAAESKEALIANGLGLDYLVLRGRRGGSAITSAAINALSRPGI